MTTVREADRAGGTVAVPSAAVTAAAWPPRLAARGKFLYAGDEKIYVKGVTYGTFRPDEAGQEFTDPELVDRDFARMAAHDINSVRTYTTPPRWMLDCALEHGLRILVGLPWEQHVTFLDDRRLARSVEARVRAGVAACAGHPAVLAYAVGNEIPAGIARWHGRRRLERFVEGLYRAAKAEDPEGIVTYVNYPSTEYLQLPFLDVVAFNVFLESRERLEAYLARLQNIAGDRPLLMTELGLDSRRHGVYAQAAALRWQLRSAFASGCAGAFVYSWTDEWHRGGFDIEDWDFGLTARDRRPKPALAAVREAFDEAPISTDESWPLVSVVVCTYNGAHTIGDCCAALRALEYPKYEVIVVDDGSTDGAGEIAGSAGFRVVRTSNQGLASARNTGLAAANGELVAYIDDDAMPDPHWLSYLVNTFRTTSHAAVGGPNVAPADGAVADAVAIAPGGPIHVLLSDQVAEHIPGCNMAFRKEALEALGGFDPQFRTAGDDVDVCWRIQDRGETIGFSPAALVWHYRRRSIRAYLRQQVGYGKAEALLERKWPEKYNVAGHATWAGRLYGPGIAQRLRRRWQVYYGTWGTGAFQRLYQAPAGTLASLALMPEWALAVLALGALSVLGLVWSPLILALPLFATAAALSGVYALAAARGVTFASRVSRPERAKRRTLTTLLHVLQPLARLRGRLDRGLTPWRRRGKRTLAVPWPKTTWIWSEEWLSPETRLARAEETLRADGVPAETGGDFDRWDLEVRGGLFGCARLRMVSEEHGNGKQLVRFRLWPRVTKLAFGVVVGSLVLAAVARLGEKGLQLVVFAGLASLVALRALIETAFAEAALRQAVQHQLPDHLLAASPREEVTRAHEATPTRTSKRRGARAVAP
jgi:O-antigen biosynthesis protein